MSEQHFFVQVDGTPGAQPEGTAGIAAVLRGADGRVLSWRCARAAARTNNEAEYQAVILGLQLALLRAPGAAVYCLTDSRMIVDQVAGRSAVHALALKPLHVHVMALRQRFRRIEFVSIPRELNRLADALAWEALNGQQGLMAFVTKQQR
jgi:ribonuclease HI